jgi:hypothetical protein
MMDDIDARAFLIEENGMERIAIDHNVDSSLLQITFLIESEGLS